ncbi:patatin-like phospholipase family protein [Thalassotalea marina]|nr:patatin-like phospholipase family protein [Thalassotalea marina]
MATKLKLGFAMGGGVSLGSFSGAALTESIKLALLYGVDGQNQPYDSVEIDVFAGASAGAMSLGIMLKCLAFPNKGAEKRNNAIQSLKTLYDISDKKWQGFSDKKQQQLVDAQLAQEVMNDIWVNQITLERLLEPDGDANIPPLKFQCGVVNKKTVVDIARANLMPSSGQYKNSDKAKHMLLANRVLYGCSIANLNPIHAKAYQLYPVAKDSNIATNDALTSFQHKEMRIFDINFAAVPSEKLSQQDQHPKRWVRLHWGDQIPDETFDLRSGDDWKHIVATAVASGSFPVAFEPVTLKRYNWEYPSTLWPYKGESSGRFSYIDGGAFNNEPVAEAFKLASHIDGLDKNTNYERRIIFVDPNVGAEPNYYLPGLTDWQTQQALAGPLKVFRAFDGNDLYQKTSLDKLIGQVVTQATVSSAQAEAKEEHRTFQIANKLLMRNELRACITNAIAPNNDNFLNLKAQIANFLTELSDKDPIPTLPTTIAGEIWRLANEKDSVVADLSPLAEQIDVSNDITEFSADEQKKIMTALVFSFVDIISGLAAKSRNSQLIAIGPFYKKSDENFEKIFLPGSPIAAFAGFMSPIPSRYEVDVARYCAMEFMQQASAIPHGKVPTTLPAPFDKNYPEYDTYMAHFKMGLMALSNRVEQMVTSSNLLNLGLINGPLLSMLASFIKDKINAIEYQQIEEVVVELRVPVSDGDFELDGKNTFDDDRHPIRLSKQNNQLYLICFATWHSKQKVWTGYNVKNGELIIDRDGFFKDKHGYYRIVLPEQNLLAESKLMGYPVFWGKTELVPSDSPIHNPITQYWLLKNELVPFTEFI